MVDIDDTGAQICPVIKQGATLTPKVSLKVYKVSWYIYNEVQNQPWLVKHERFFSTKEAALQFNEKRTEAAKFLGIKELKMTGYPIIVEVENE